MSTAYTFIIQRYGTQCQQKKTTTEENDEISANFPMIGNSHEGARAKCMKCLFVNKIKFPRLKMPYKIYRLRFWHALALIYRKY